jgi:hypothetical protein
MTHAWRLLRKGIKKVLDEQVDKHFKDVLVDEEKVPEKFLRILQDVKKAKKDFLAKKLTKQELNKVKKEARVFIKAMVEHLQRKRIFELERARIRFKYGKDKVGEVLVLGNDAFITKDLEHRDKLLQAKVAKDGSLLEAKESSLEKLEKHLKEKHAPKKLFINEKLFDALKDIVGKPIEIMVNY